MTFNSITKLITRQIKEKWGRTLLASIGIMIGIWAITLTVALSLGLSGTIVCAINSQPGAKSFQLYKLEGGEGSFFELQEAPKFVSLSQGEIDDLVDKYPSVVGAVPSSVLNFYIPNKDVESLSCVETGFEALATIEASRNPANANLPQEQKDQIQQDVEDAQNFLVNNCPRATIISSVFQNYYENNKRNWYGSEEEPGDGEIAACFRCGQLEFYKLFEGVENPEDLLGKTVEFEYQSAPIVYEPGSVLDVTTGNQGSNEFLTSEKETFTITSVVDDRNTNAFGAGISSFYIDSSYYGKAAKLQDPLLTDDQIGYVEIQVYIDNYENLESTFTQVRSDGLLPFSIAEVLITSINVVFTILTSALAAFGVIVLVAAMFGIIAVMIISVLERKKEIGVLKSLGARNFDIFTIFMIESVLLGVFGWILGTLFTLVCGFIITGVANTLAFGNDEISANLEALNITSFDLAYPWYLLGGTFALAVFFTAISGVIPAINASRQNPVDVLRSE